ncbi:hypothetical protein G4G93_03720 [Methylobacterium sp. DB0501]|uniref:hypothetical protein n=1 Tax=Methylobacterium sp. DB0501 TaxID=2709665 RepID=UPI0013E9BD64|nr:hypothetical protein [Methylobacterium sp. DB0501]NGM33052.1 hypothetical protein [Methylobacterium sp. DB0501]
MPDLAKLFDGVKLFDAYSLRARVCPALLAFLPTLALLFVLVPWDRLRLSNTLVSVMSLVLLYAATDLAQRRGKVVEVKLGTRTSPEIWHRNDPAIPEPSKARYRAFVAAKISVPVPAEQDEQTQLQQANAFYLAAADWLRENTRDHKRFSILFDNLISYGYRRNLLGLKPVALVCNGFVASSAAAILWLQPPLFTRIEDLNEKLLGVTVAVVLHSAYMLFAVTAAPVRDASRTYGRRLALSCEGLLAADPKATSKPKSPRAASKKGLSKAHKSGPA